MTASDNTPIPDFFNEDSVDPVAAATGRPVGPSPVPKRKVGFYFSEALIERFNRTFHQLKLDKVAIDNKSALAELALHFALDDLERKMNSQLLKRIAKMQNDR
jgi:hypothetical protein